MRDLRSFVLDCRRADASLASDDDCGPVCAASSRQNTGPEPGFSAHPRDLGSACALAALSRSGPGFDAVWLVEGVVRIPRVVLLVSFDRVPQRRVRFSRHNIFVRDANTCQYCARRFARSELNLDHVVPRCRGGRTTWENVVCSCIECNRRKGGTDPAAAGMKLIRLPQRPAWSPFVAKQFGVSGYREWVPFLRAVDTAYWNVELDPD
jgi:5-methylcytosine-specific restriction endonuclease McrA